MDALQGLIERLDEDASLMEPNRLHQRLDALDRLDAYFPEVALEESADAEEVYQRARSVCARLEAVNEQLYEEIRCEMRRGQPESLLRWFRASPDADRQREAAEEVRYDHLDELLSGVLQMEEPVGVVAQRESEMVFYQPTPARAIFELLCATSLTAADVLVDLGSGMGHVPLLVSICTGARSVGIEVEKSYVECAQRCADGLSLGRVAFLQQDARVADVSEGTVFYLYTPFRGSILRCVLDHLRGEAAGRCIRVCTYGPCTAAVAEEPWLEAVSEIDTGRIAVFVSNGLS